MRTRGLLVIMLLVSPLVAQESSSESGIEFFEKRIRPVLDEQCIACHNMQKRNGGLSLDHRDGWQQGGDSGEVIVSGKPDESLLMRVLQHEEPGMEMPAKAPKLENHTIADFAEWIRRGAPDPRLKPTQPTNAPSRTWNEIRDERVKWWSFQPLSPHQTTSGDSSAIDQLIDARLSSVGLQAAHTADRRTRIRRLSYILRGLPPTIDEVNAFTQDASPNAWEQCVDRMLASPSFGEYWARHWMDVVRYADTHGSEDDAYLPFAYRYRDYLIRAFNNDVPFDQLIREHIAGDVIAPRWNDQLDLNESIIGTAFWRFVEFNQTPVDVKREEIIVIDSQIDAMGKAFQALTISCARCHDHKFDPISDEDYYALYGILRSTRSGLRVIDAPGKFTQFDQPLGQLAHDLKPALATAWLSEVNAWPERIRSARDWIRSNVNSKTKAEEIEKQVPEAPWTKSLWAATQQPSNHPLGLMSKLTQLEGDDFRKSWTDIANSQKQIHEQVTHLPDDAKELFDLRTSIEGWQPVGAGLPNSPQTQAGGFGIHAGSTNWIGSILEQGFHSNPLSDRHNGVIRSPDFIVDHDIVSVQTCGSGNPRVRLVIENFQGDSLLFETVNQTVNSPTMRWYRMTIRPQWRGLRAHVEMMTRDDKPYVGVVKNPENLEKTDGRSSFGIARVVAHSHASHLPDAPILPIGLWSGSCESSDHLISQLCRETNFAIERLQAGNCTNADARWLSVLIDANILSVPSDSQNEANKIAKAYQTVENQIPIARRSPGVFEDHCAVEQPFLPRGNHKQPQDLVPRRYLEILDGDSSNYAGIDSGRLRLANAIANPNNPLTARVYANRIWHCMFGTGIVPTVDNFGRMGESPTHPELLDELAWQLIESGWSTKQLIRAIVLSETWQRDSLPTASAKENDLINALWSHMQMRRIDAESIRDTMLQMSGKLKTLDQGLGTRVYYRSVFDPNKQSPPGPLDGDQRRSIFLEVRRNFPNEFLTAFDFPKPTAPAGRRSQTTVPQQSLVLLNDPFTLLQSQLWATRVCHTNSETAERIKMFYSDLLSREPTPDELRAATSFVEDQIQLSNETVAWGAMAHAMFNLKEMIFLR